MSKTDWASLVIFPILVLIGALVAWAGSQGGATVGGIPIFALVVSLAFVIQWLVFIPSFIYRTEKFYDLTGSLTFISMTLLTVILSPGVDARAILLAALVIVWAARLGSFLFGRIRKSGKDERFDELKLSFPRFLNAWTIQGLWASLAAATAWVAITTEVRKPFDGFAWVGLSAWVVGFLIEVVADAQKTRFKSDPANRGRFIRTGLWSRSRHPNYFGEIVVWFGVAIIAFPVLHGWQWIAMISPFFVMLLLTKISGIPLLERKADQTWGGQDDYEEYKRQTPILIPKLSRNGRIEQ